LVHSGDVKIYEHQSALPRAFVAPQAVVAGSEAEALALLANPNFDVGQVVVLAAAPPAAVATEPGAVLTATLTTYAAEHVQVRATGPGFLVLTDAHYPGWAATVDGQPAAIYRADVLFRAVALPPGEHLVEFRFAPRSLAVGLSASAIGWLVWLAVWVAAWRATRSS
jgi:hypothetical protein